MKSNLEEIQAMQAHVLILLQGLVLEGVEFNEETMTFLKTTSENVIKKIDDLESQDIISPISNREQQEIFNIEDVEMTKSNLTILKRALKVQKIIEKELDDYINEYDKMDQYKLDKIKSSVIKVQNLLEDRVVIDGYTPVWSPFSMVNSREHIRILKENNLHNHAVEFIKWRSQCARNREDNLFGLEIQYHLELFRLYLVMKNWKGAKSIINKNLNMAKDETPPNENMISIWLEKLADYYHQKENDVEMAK